MKKFQNISFIFDVDSTLVKDETLESVIEIAINNFINKEKILEKIKKITNLGMEGKLDFKESLEKRLGVVQILQEHLDLYNKKILPKQIDFTFKKIFKIIEDNGGKVFIVSGGFMDNIKVVADKLNINKKDCFANDFLKNNNKIVGFDENNLLSNGDGKVKVARKIKIANKTKRLVCIGDGNGDYLIKKEGVANEFWGFWGNIKRKNIERQADKNFYSSQELLDFIKTGEDVLFVNK